MTAAKKWLKQAEIDARARKRIATKLTALIRAYDGSPAEAKEILQRIRGSAPDGHGPAAVRGSPGQEAESLQPSAA